MKKDTHKEKLKATLTHAFLYFWIFLKKLSVSPVLDIRTNERMRQSLPINGAHQQNFCCLNWVFYFLYLFCRFLIYGVSDENFLHFGWSRCNTSYGNQLTLDFVRRFNVLQCLFCRSSLLSRKGKSLGVWLAVQNREQ